MSSFEVRFPFFTTKVRSSYALSFQISFLFFSVILEAFRSARQSLYLCLRVETLPFALKNKEPERHVYFFLKRITRTSRDVLSFYFLLFFYLFPRFVSLLGCASYFAVYMLVKECDAKNINLEECRTQDFL